MRAPLIVPADPPPHGATGLDEAGEALLPDALFLQTAEEALDHPVLLRRVRRDELLAQPVVATRGPKPPALEDQAVVAADYGCGAIGPQRAEAINAGFLERAFGLLRATPSSRLVAHDLPIVAVDDRGEVSPAVHAAVDVRHVHGPAFVAPGGTASPPLHAGPRGRLSLVDEPTLELERAVHGLPVDRQPFPEPEKRPETTISERRMQRDQSLQTGGKNLIDHPRALRLHPLAHRRARHA